MQIRQALRLALAGVPWWTAECLLRPDLNNQWHSRDASVHMCNIQQREPYLSWIYKREDLLPFRSRVPGIRLILLRHRRRTHSSLVTAYLTYCNPFHLCLVNLEDVAPHYYGNEQLEQCLCRFLVVSESPSYALDVRPASPCIHPQTYTNIQNRRHTIPGAHSNDPRTSYHHSFVHETQGCRS